MSRVQVQDGKPYSPFPSVKPKTLTGTWVKPAFSNVEVPPETKPVRDGKTGDDPRDRFALIAAVVVLAGIVLAAVMLI